MLKRERKRSLASEMRHRIYIQTKVNTTDGSGGFTSIWTNSSSQYWAAVYPLSASQTHDFRNTGVEATHKIKIRGGITVTEKDRILYGSRILEILTVEDAQERGVVQWILCREDRRA